MIKKVDKILTLSKRIIPCLDVNNGRVVKGINFKGLRDAGDPASLGKKYSDDGADELVFLDITASPERRKILSKMVNSVATELDIPFTVGGGIRTMEDARVVLSSGADKVSINTAAVENPRLIEKLSYKFGQQCIVVAIDVKKSFSTLGRTISKEDCTDNSWFEVYTYGGRKPTGLNALEWASQVEELGAGELLVTSMDMDGTRRGYDLDLTRDIGELVNVPIIASGGCGTLKHFSEVFTLGKADAALAASVFHYDEFPVHIVKEHLKREGLSIRF